MALFMEMPKLQTLEENNQWDDAIQMLRAVWHEDIHNKDCLIRYIAECWYVLVYWNYELYLYIKLEYASINLELREATKYGMNYFKDDFQFALLCGYMINTFPEFFTDEEEYEQWQDKGRMLLEHASELIPNDKLAKYWRLGTGYYDEVNEKVMEEYKCDIRIDEYFPGKTAIELYFVSLLV